MSELKCPFCQQEYIIHKDDPYLGQQCCVCRNPNCEFDGWHFPVKFVSELICAREALEQSEICCSEWEKQALDYKAENIALSGELERTRKENEDKQAVLNYIADMVKTLNQRYALIMGKDVIKETVRLLEQNKGGDNE